MKTIEERAMNTVKRYCEVSKIVGWEFDLEHPLVQTIQSSMACLERDIRAEYESQIEVTHEPIPELAGTIEKLDAITIRVKHEDQSEAAKSFLDMMGGEPESTEHIDKYSRYTIDELSNVAVYFKPFKVGSVYVACPRFAENEPTTRTDVIEGNAFKTEASCNQYMTDKGLI